MAFITLFFIGVRDWVLSLWEMFWKYRYMYLEGTGITLILSLFTVVFGAFVGLLIAILRRSGVRVLRGLAVAYIEVIRGTPLMVQIMILYFGLNSLGARLPAFAAGILSLSINSGAYIAEIFRSGIQAVDAGQSEAALALGMSAKKTMRLIILPQAVRNILPALANEFITVIKESSLVSFATVAELTFMASRVRGATFRAVEPYLLSAVIYFALTFTLSKFLALLERRLRANDRTA